MKSSGSVRTERFRAVRRLMDDLGFRALLLSVGADLPWLTGYEAMPLERLTMLVVPGESEAVLVLPALEAPRVADPSGLFRVRPFSESEDPVAIVASLVGDAGQGKIAVSDRTWARFVLQLQQQLPSALWGSAREVTGPLRRRKDPIEIAALKAVAEAADRVAEQLRSGDLALLGRSEAEVSREIARRLIDEGHDRVNFSIVASGPNAASPHHEASGRVIEKGDPVVCDFGGSMVPPDERAAGGAAGYCSDITRTVVAGGQPDADFVEIYETVREAQKAGVSAAETGNSCEAVDAASRATIDQAGYGSYFIHRTGHGIGIEEHEEPYLVVGNPETLLEGDAFSVEPGIYIPGRYGVRIEDIVVATAAGPVVLNQAGHELVVVDA